MTSCDACAAACPCESPRAEPSAAAATEASPAAASMLPAPAAAPCGGCAAPAAPPPSAACDVVGAASWLPRSTGVSARAAAPGLCGARWKLKEGGGSSAPPPPPPVRSPGRGWPTGVAAGCSPGAGLRGSRASPSALRFSGGLRLLLRPLPSVLLLLCGASPLQTEFQGSRAHSQDTLAGVAATNSTARSRRHHSTTVAPSQTWLCFNKHVETSY